MIPTALSCPKCGADMRTYERSGIHVDQCGECRGIFLDRGELERLMDAETAHYARDQRPSAAPAPIAAGAAPGPDRRDEPRRDPDRRERQRDDDWDDDWDERRDGRDGRGRKGGFLGGMFDMIGD